MRQDTALVRETLAQAGLGSPRELEAWTDRPGTTGRLLLGELDGLEFVAKVADEPGTLERAGREAAVLSTLGRSLDGIAPRLLAARTAIDHVIVIVERIHGRHGDGVAGAGDEEIEAIARRLHATWALDATDDRVIELDLPNWGRGTTSDDPHRRRRDRLARRIEVACERFDHAARHRASLTTLRDRFETLADRAGRDHARLVHGDLHLDNVVFTEDGPRILDWQKTSVGDPLDDLSRLVLEAAPRPTLDRLHRSARELPGSTPTTAQVSVAVLMAWSGFITGLAGRPRLEPGSRDHRMATRLLGPEGPWGLVAEALETMDAPSTS